MIFWEWNAAPMRLVVYLNPSGGADPGHMVVGQEFPAPAAYFGYRFNPLDLPDEFRPPGQWRKYLSKNHVPGHIVDESDYAEAMAAAGRVGYYQKRAECDRPIAGVVPPEETRKGYARYSFNPDDFVKQGEICFNCVTWATLIANQIVGGFLTPVRQGRVTEMAGQLERCVTIGGPMEKKIVALSRAPFTVELEDRPCSVFVSAKDGKILIDEGGDGDDRLNGAVLYADQGPRFAVRGRSTDDASDSLQLECGTFSLRLGAVPPGLDAAAWAEEVNAFLASKGGRLPAVKTPADRGLDRVEARASSESLIP